MESKGDGTARFIASSIASFVAEIITLPADVAKVRLQLQKKSAGDVQYRGFVDCLKKTYRNEGPKALFKGLNPALVRQISYSSLSMVLYEPIRDVLCGEEKDMKKIPFWKRLLAGGTAGGISIAIFNPTEVVKTQMQSANLSCYNTISVYNSLENFIPVSTCYLGRNTVFSLVRF